MTTPTLALALLLLAPLVPGGSPSPPEDLHVLAGPARLPLANDEWFATMADGTCDLLVREYGEGEEVLVLHEGAARGTWSVFYFEELGPKRTKITVVGLGYTDDPQSKEMRAGFAAANAWSLKQLAAALED